LVTDFLQAVSHLGPTHALRLAYRSARSRDISEFEVFLLGRMDLKAIWEMSLYIGRRHVRMAVEDIGMADPQALVQANVAKG